MGENRWLRNSFVYLIILVTALALFWQYVGNGSTAKKEVDISQIVNDALAGRIERIEAFEDDNRLTAQYKDGTTASSRKGSNVDLVELLRQQAVELQQLDVMQGKPPREISLPEIDIKPAPAWGNLLGAFTFLLPTLLIIGFFIFFMRQAQGSNNQALSFGKSRARMFTGDKPTITFADVAGQEEAKQDLTEVVEFLKFPEKFAQLGARIPRGVLMVGPPGTGKTLLSRAVAGEAGVPFFSISGSEFVEMFVGVGASRVRDLFDQAKRNAPCIVFIDEIDAVGRQRGAGLGGSHDEREQTLNQILVEMDGFDTNTNVIVIAATNRPDVLDPALIRPGRFDRQVVLDSPDVRGRLEILKVHTRGKPLAEDVDLQAIAKLTPGSSGADLANIVNEAAILAARRSKKKITMLEFEDATERLMMGGPERRSRVMTPREKEITAFHEAGHTIVAHAMPGANPVHKVTIVPRGRAGGYTLMLPDEDQNYMSVSQFEAMLAVALGGRAAEEIVFGDFTTGAQGDIQQVTRVARAMVTRYGMSSQLGPVAFGEKEELIFLGREISEQRNYSEETARLIDAEVKRLVETGHERARQILEENREVLNRMAEALIEYETLDGERLRTILSEVRRYTVNGVYKPQTIPTAAA
ncbi:MAG: ATP-dependent zinc metalloprotease FtsH [Herpetosiphonaceae bacterium]|nr:MAG: ATP-dependent zinc metalloprotease FtsH [Herpetosiphonaceae bacterium]